MEPMIMIPEAGSPCEHAILVAAEKGAEHLTGFSCRPEHDNLGG